jgi:hypothetical protein
MVEQADPSSSLLLCPRSVDDGKAEKSSRYVSAERREKQMCKVDQNGYWRCCDRLVDDGHRSSPPMMVSVDSRYQTGRDRR